ncbi:alpha-D-ribose 1-methylphosphonate 5-triphosphate synthase subunit PhnG [Gracilibacillus ureilyticus]|uniref:Alpha-D-ribose 1-methylphosphonate 5-triphosphate synthase subunit PhnG n=1 Tax=Gracilibacillus ureilyticus TaxID=531814 RepID=A0A1H9MR86_9BACI|nr:phosphonate C-P lyase system protein PhnG [Gracilibacillus ureilyticus]SER25997.1 alpha-D-ribose 1-methylphosphonate 5-triphosphate synthase subunit PhnG [Gracilibacillus ureilyticus]
MNRKRRTEILIQNGGNLAKELAEVIKKKYEYQPISEPEYGLTMIKMRESAKKSLFYIGEVMVTEAKVEINQSIGIGIVIGMEDELAQHLAIIDAAYRANLPETVEWEPVLETTAKQLEEQRAREQRVIFETKVDFETMEV